MGVDPDHVGSDNFHVMFSVVVHVTGRFVSPLMPLADGPRHCGQFSACATRVTVTLRATDKVATASIHMLVRPFCSYFLLSTFYFLLSTFPPPHRLPTAS